MTAAMSASLRRRALWVAAGLTLAATAWVASQDEPAPESRMGTPRGTNAVQARERRAGPANAEPLQQLQIDLLRRTQPAAESGDLFPARSWEPPPRPPAQAPPAKPEAPRPPPLALTYIGRMVEGDKAVVFLARQERSYAVRKGDTIDATYRVEDILDNAIVLTYLPLGQKQSLSTGAAR